MAIECLVLGAGQEVGKSCVVVTIGGKKIMFDCGMHMGCVDNPYPDFSRISPTGDFDSVLSCVIITHCHLDHVGALPFFTQVCGYRGPIYMTYPTKALSPIMLEDYHKILTERSNGGEKFTLNDIKECMKKVIPVNIKETVQVDRDLQIRAYYAGHVLGAAMFYAKVGESTLVYTGDYSMTPDRHLGAAEIDRIQLDLLITESTYATTTRDSRFAREREFLNAVHKCVGDGGKVLMPTFAMGRAQELGIMLNDYWERMNLEVPIYFSAGLTLQANVYYKMLIGWTSQKIKESYLKCNPFDFKHVLPFHRSQIDAPGPCVLFATPGMLTGGFSLEVFKKWAPSKKNLVMLPGYCIAGSVGHQLMSGKATTINLDKNTQIDVRCQIHQISFSPHTDSKGIMDLIQFLSPHHVMLMHGEKLNMEKLKGKIQSELGIQCYNPANNETQLVPTTHPVKIHASEMYMSKLSSANFIKRYDNTDGLSEDSSKDLETSHLHVSRNENFGEGILIMERKKRAKFVHEDELLQTLNAKEHKVKIAGCFLVDIEKLRSSLSLQSNLIECGGHQFSENANRCLGKCNRLHLLQLKLKELISVEIVCEDSDKLLIGSLCICVCRHDNCPHRCSQDANSVSQPEFFCCTWSFSDEKLAGQVISIMKNPSKE